MHVLGRFFYKFLFKDFFLFLTKEARLFPFKVIVQNVTLKCHSAISFLRCIFLFCFFLRFFLNEQFSSFFIPILGFKISLSF